MMKKFFNPIIFNLSGGIQYSIMRPNEIVDQSVGVLFKKDYYELD
jgi:hypothetical protein